MNAPRTHERVAGAPGRLPAQPPVSPAGAELARKGLHVAAAAAAAAIAAGLPDTTSRAVLGGAVAVALAVEGARRVSPAFRDLFIRLVGPMLRPAERDGLSGATTLALGCAAAVFLFPGELAAVGCLYAGFADTAAALAGRRFGRRRSPWGSSLEGAAAFFAAALLVGWITPALPFGPAALAALFAAILEAATPHGFDNLVVPLGGTAAVVLSLLLL